MAKIVVVGGGMCGLGASMMLAKRGHEVTVLERNPEPPPDSAQAAWEAWERPGVGQFRMGHYFLARYRQIIAAELPELLPEFEAVGALTLKPLDNLPPGITDRAPREGDDQFEVITGRRPVFEWVVARAVANAKNIDLRRGVGVESLLTGPSVADGVPHVVGVRTEAGDELRADLVIDAGGRRSAYGTWLEEIGGRPFYEEDEDSGFRYYGRYFRAGPGGWPAPPGPTIGILGSVAMISLPADNDTWMTGIITSAKDKDLYGFTEEGPWTRAMAATPMLAPWIDGEPITEVETIVAIPDRYRRFVVDDQPVATGIAAIADAMCATNPMRGRGVSMGMIHAQCLMDATAHLDDHVEFARVLDAATEERVTPFYRNTVELDRGMRDAFDAVLRGEEPTVPSPDDPMAQMQARFFAMVAVDADVYRAFGKLVGLLDVPEKVVMEESIVAKLLAYEGDTGGDPFTAAGPTRQELVDIAHGA